jgi:uncharacterized protein YmfQ (DUF2313 family)
MAVDHYIKRTADDYAEAFAGLLPQGPAWKRDQDEPLMQLQAGLAGIWGDVAQRADDLLVRETDPRATVELLPDWEQAFGLPDLCLAEPLTIGDRQTALVSRMTTQGGQSRAFFTALAASIGYTLGTIREYSPFMVGISQVGDTTDGAGGPPRWELGPPEMRFYWTVKVSNVRLTWFRVSDGQVGVDPHLRIAQATDLECLLRRYKPAHTSIIFDYSGLVTNGAMAGTP